MENKKTAKIYAYKNKGKIIYIGKTININNSGTFTLSTPRISYFNSELGKRVINNVNASVEVLEEVEVDNWFDPKLKKIVEKHKEGAKLLNAQHFLEGKRGYWEGKKRDNNTIQKLGESKYKRIIQYDKNGNLVKVWNSGKEIGVEVFKDYKLSNGGGDSVIYDITKRVIFKNRFVKNSYWIKEEELRTTVIPKKINIQKILDEQAKARFEKRSKLYRDNPQYIFRNNKPIVRIIKGNRNGKIFDSILDAAKYYRICPTVIGKLCRYERKSSYDGKFRFEFVNQKDRDKYIHNKNKLYGK